MVKIKTPKVVRVYNTDGTTVKVPMKDQSWEHLALFESELKPADFLNSKYKSENYQEWLGKYKLGKWKLVDIDNFMYGNPLFTSTTYDEFKEDLFQGSKKYDPELRTEIGIDK